MKKIYSIIDSLEYYSGAGKVMIDIHNGLSNYYSSKILMTHSIKTRHYKYNIEDHDCHRLSNPYILKNNIIFVHARKILFIIIILNKLLRLNITIIYISHSIFNNKKTITLLPNHVVAISNKVYENLVSYFDVKKENIQLIHNGVKDRYIDKKINDISNVIKILYIARIDKGKRQLEIINNMGDKLNSNIEIHFAGDGEDLIELKKKSEKFKNFKVIGFIDNIDSIIHDYHYVMLYSIKEGLPISLIEGIMHKKPLLINDVGGNLEIGIPGYNAILLNDNWNKMIEQINALVSIDTNNYHKMCENSRKLYLENFKYEMMINSYKEYIDKIG